MTNKYNQERKEYNAKNRLKRAAENLIKKIPDINAFGTYVYENGRWYRLHIEKIESD